MMTSSTTHAPTSDEPDTEITSIIGFVCVLVILIGAIMAVVLLCICYGVRKLHGPQAARTASRSANPSRPPSASSLQRANSIKGKSPSFLQSPLELTTSPRPHPLVVDTPHIPVTSHSTQPDMAVISLAQISSTPLSSVAPSPLGHAPHTIPRGINPHYHAAFSHQESSRRAKPLPPLQLEHIHGPNHSPVVVRAQKTPRSASVEFQPQPRAPRSASTEFYRQNSRGPGVCADVKERKVYPTLSSGGSALEGSNASVVVVSKASSTITARSTEV